MIYGKMARSGDHTGASTPAQRDMTARPRLEPLEDRLTPATFDTMTNVAISITPNFLARMATETITATVTQAGTTTPVTTGTINFNLNGQTGTAALNSSGQATFTTTLPTYAVAGNQTLNAVYAGATDASGNVFNSSMFLSPVYLNVMNAVFASQITFGTPPTATFSPSFNSAGGESDMLAFFIPIKFNYVDPGTIQTFSVFGLSLPGSLSGTLFAGVESFVASSTGQLL
jgi:hypothetical protein